MRSLRLALAQINATVGDFDGNLEKVIKYMADARTSGADIIVFPELAVCGYPPEDLLFKPRFIEKNLLCLDRIIEASSGIAVIIGFVNSEYDIFNAAAVINNGTLAGVYHKIYLPNYGVFDENRYFQAGKECPVYTICGVGVGINVCEDIWYEAGPATIQALAGAEIIINISSSPYHAGKSDFRERMIRTRAIDSVAVIAQCNLVGGQDELVFDGNSIISDERGNLIARGKKFQEDLIISDIDVEAVFRTRLHDSRWRKEELLNQEKRWQITKTEISDKPNTLQKSLLQPQTVASAEYQGEIYDALVLGTRDYVKKNGFKKVVIGISGGIDSSLVTAIAVDALGADNVIGISMPSRYSSTETESNTRGLANNLGIKLISIPIEPVYESYLKTLSEPFAGLEPDLTEENIQARIRGDFLMAMSNKFRWLVLTTGNKSEMATGYTTLYGDMAGGFAVIKDVPKTIVYELCEYRNSIANNTLIPRAVIDREPTAELRFDQKDSDSLPPYDILDPILMAYVEEDKSIDQIIDMGYQREIVEKTARLVDISEYKRRQAPPGIKITPRAFGRDWRLPITNKFRGD